MNKLQLMQRFMDTFVGKDFQLLIKERGDTFQVHTIEIMEKTDDTCPIKEIPVGDYFLHLAATNQQGNDASIVCNWAEELLRNLVAAHKEAKDADVSSLTMCKQPFSSNPNEWLLIWGNDKEKQEQMKAPQPIAYAG
jgi:hypothetical protein